MTNSENTNNHKNNPTSDSLIIAKMRTLIEALKSHNNAYYVLDSPIIEDSEYDQLRRSLLELEEQYPDLIQPDSPINQVGDVPLSAFTQVSQP